MSDLTDREAMRSRLRAQYEEVRAANKRLVASTLKSKELLEQSRALLAESRIERVRMRSIMDSILEEIWYCDTERVVTPMNPAAHKLLRFGKSEDGRMPMRKWLARLEFRGEDGVPLTAEETPLVRSLNGETVAEFRELVQVPFASQILVREVNSAPVRNEEGDIVGAVAVVRNIA